MTVPPPGSTNRPRVLVREPIASSGLDLLKARFEVVLEGGRNVCVYRDAEKLCWFTQQA